MAWVEFRNGRFRMALAVLIWPRGWTHTRIDTGGSAASEEEESS